MVGSLGRLGVLAEVALKVFPRPAASATVAFELGTLDAALAAIATLARGPLELDALDLEPPGRVLARIEDAHDVRLVMKAGDIYDPKALLRSAEASAAAATLAMAGGGGSGAASLAADPTPCKSTNGVPLPCSR